MFSIAAINDIDSSRNQLEPLAPTKEAQESLLKKVYEEALYHLENGRFLNAQTLFQTIIQDQLCLESQVQAAPNSGSMLQLRFLTFKNLAEAYLRQGDSYYKDALNCYLEAVSINGKDVVLWNRLGTLACTLGLCSVARKAFEKGLQCSPRHWSCMEKLAEVLIDIGDENACLSIVNRLLKYYPSHPRALHIRNMILSSSKLSAIKPEKVELITPVGLDLLEPQHCSLVFPRKRKLEEAEDAGRHLKKSQCQTIKVDLQGLSWAAVLRSLCQVSRNMGGKGNTQEISEAVDSLITAKDGENHLIFSPLTNAHVSFITNSEGSGLLDVRTENSSSPVREVETISIDDVQQASAIACNGVAQFYPKPSTLNSEDQESKLINGELIEGSEVKKGCLNEANERVFLSLQRVEGKVDSFRSKDMVNDEEPQAGERRSSRLERLRTRRYDKNEDSETTQVKSWQIFKQVVEEFCISCEQESDGHHERSSESIVNRDLKNAGICQSIAGCFVHAVKCCKNEDCADALMKQDASKGEAQEVASFLREFSCNSGILHVGNSVLERIILTYVNQQSIRPYLLELEKFTRDWVKDRSHLCSLFFAEVYLDEAVISGKDFEIKQHLKNCDYYLCKLLEFRAIHVFPPCIVASQKLDQQCEAKKVLSPMHWSFWLRFHYVSARFWMLSGDPGRGYEEFQECLSIFRAEEEADNPLVQVILPHCRVDNKISAERIERLLYEYHLEDLLRHTAARMLEKGQFSELIDLLAPILLPSNGAVDVMSSCVTGTATSHFSQELMGLEILLSACENVCPLNYRIAFQCYYRRLEIFCRLTGILNSTITDILVSPELNISMYDLEQDQNKGKGAVKKFSMIWKELKVISNSVAHIKEKMDETGNLISSFMSTDILGKIQQLLILIMGHFLSIINNRKCFSAVNSGFEEDIESSCLVDTAVAFCRIQHLQTCATVEQQVGLLITVHELLAECGLCCAGLNCEGGEGAFLKMAIKHLLALEISLKDTSSSLSQHTTGSHKSYRNADMNSDKQDELLIEFASDSCDRDSVQEVLPSEKPVGKTKRKNDQSKMFHEQSIHSTSKTSSESASSKSCKETKKLTSCVGDQQDVDTVKERSLELRLENALDQSFFCLYGLNLRGGLESNNQDGLAMHKNTSRGDFQTKEQCAGVLQYVLPYAKVCSRSCLMKLRKVLRAVRKQFPKPLANVLDGNPIDLFLDDTEFDEEIFCNLAVSASQTETLMYALHRGDKTTYSTENVQDIGKSSGAIEKASGQNARKANSFLDVKALADAPPTTDKISNGILSDDLEPYNEVYANLYYLLTQVEDMSASDKWPGFVLTSEGEEFVEQNASLFKFDLLYNPSRFDSWKRLASIYDEEVDLMLNDGSKNVNVLEWRKNTKFMSRVENSRRRSRRCLLMSLALTCCENEQSEMHEMLALVYYDALQNVVPSYDQRELVPVRNSSWMSICKNSFRHFEAAFSYKSDWTHLLYMGKLCEKMGRCFNDAFSYYRKAIEINPAVVDPIYRLHRSRLKLLCRAGCHDFEVLQTVARYCFVPSNTDNISSKLSEFSANMPVQQSSLDKESVEKESEYHGRMGSSKFQSSQPLGEYWNLLFEDCMSAMHMCIEGELKHFHKARFSLAQGLKYRDDLEKAKEELSFCFKSGRSPFIINMWELDGVVKKSKRKTTSSTSGKRLLDLGLPESSRKFITCVRKYLLVYLGLCEHTRDLATLERAYTSLKIDKKFSLCLDDVASIALGKYIRTLVATIGQVLTEGCMESYSLNVLLEKIFNVFMEHGSSCFEAVALTFGEAGTTNACSEDSIYSYIHTYLQHLEREGKIETLESVNERIRKRFKNSKLSNAYSSKVCKHASLAWCRALCFALSEITPLPCDNLLHPRESSSDANHLIQFIIDLKEDKPEAMLYNAEFCQSSSQALITVNESGLTTSRRELHFVPIVQVPAENMEKAATLLRSTYIFYRESSSGPFPGGINLYIKAPYIVNTGIFNEVLNSISSLGFPIGPEALDVSTPRKLILWAFSLVHGRACSVAEAVKYCEEQAKLHAYMPAVSRERRQD